MTDWNASRLKAASDIGSALVVLLGLVFVGVELRQNTEAVEAETIQGLTAVSNDFILAIATDPELVRVWKDGSFDPDSLNEIDSARFFLLTRSYWLRIQSAYSQYERGALSADDWKVYESLICGIDYGIDSGKGFIQTLSDHEFMLRPALVEIIKSCPTS